MNPSPHPAGALQGLAAPDAGARMCPYCKGSLDRIPRHTLDFAISMLVPVRRYRCLSIGCGWEGRLRKRRDSSSDVVAGRRPYL